MLKNPFYAGRLVVGQWEMDCKGAFESIVSIETFQLVQAILAGGRTALTPRRRSHPDFPLRHFFSCGACERPLTGSWSKGRNNAYAYYHCAQRCAKSRNIPKKLLETDFLKLVEQVQPKPEYLNLFRAIVIDVWERRQSETIKLEAMLKETCGIDSTVR